MNNLSRSFRRYHRAIALIVALPLIATALTGIAYTILDQWLDQPGNVRAILLSIHTGRIIHLEMIYPILNGVGLLGLLVTGLSMTGLFRRRSKQGN